MKVLDLKFIRYANLFNGVTKIRSKHCFEYNNSIVFAVPRRFVAQAIGHDNRNLERLSQLIGKRIRIAAIPESKEDLESFVSIIVSTLCLEKVQFIFQKFSLTLKCNCVILYQLWVKMA